MERDETRQMLAEYESYKAQAEALQESMGLIEASIVQITTALEALKAAGSMDREKEILLPIGPDSFIKAMITDSKNAFVGIGSGVVVKKPISEAIKSLDGRRKELEERRSEIGETLQKVAKAAQELAPRLRELVGKAQKEG